MRFRWVFSLLLLTLLAAPILYAVGAGDTRDEELAHYDKELNKVFGKLIQQLDPKEQQKLKAAQRAWLKMRDLDCEWAFVDRRDCLIDRTVNRTTELKKTDFQSKSGKYGSIEYGGIN